MSSDFPRSRRRRRARFVDLFPSPEEREEDEGIGDIDDDFDTVEIDDVIRQAQGGRMPAVETDGI